MKKSLAVLATVALGAMLAVGPVTASMAHGGGGGFGGGHGGGFGGGHGGGFGGGHAFGGSHDFGGGYIWHPHFASPGFGHPFFDHGYGRPFFDHGFAGRHFVRRNFGGFDPFWGPDSYYYLGYNNDAAYCASVHRTYDPRSGTYVGRDGLRHYCP